MLKSLEGIVEWVKWIELPKEHNGRLIKDITDLRSHCQGEGFLDLLADLQVKARLIDKGVDIEAYTMAELEQQYITEVESFSKPFFLVVFTCATIDDSISWAIACIHACVAGH